jgi:hypothetical protein
MNNVLKYFMAGLLLIGAPGAILAATGTTTFTVSATVPAASSVSIAASKVNSSTNVFTPVTGTLLNFDPLSFDNTNKIYLPDHYFAIDIGPNGAGATSATVSYTEGANPNAATGGHGLGWKTTATFKKIVGTTESDMAAHPVRLLKTLSTAENITSAEIGNGFLRVYLGIVANPTAAGVPAGAEVFSGADKVGNYTGSLVVSATVV